MKTFNSVTLVPILSAALKSLVVPLMLAVSTMLMASFYATAKDYQQSFPQSFVTAGNGQHWQQGFADETLNQLVASTLRNNATLAMAEATIDRVMTDVMSDHEDREHGVQVGMNSAEDSSADRQRMLEAMQDAIIRSVITLYGDHRQLQSRLLLAGLPQTNSGGQSAKGSAANVALQHQLSRIQFDLMLLSGNDVNELRMLMATPGNINASL